MDSDGAQTRARIKIACEECRKGKRKCDGQKPTCSLCQRSGRVCLYASEASRKRKHHDEEYIRGLQDQIETLNSELSEFKKYVGLDMVHRSSNPFVTASPSLHPRDEPATAMRSNHQATESKSLDSRSSEHSQAADARSPIAMEELATLMLKVDLEDRGEPSFTISSREAPARIHRVPEASVVSADLASRGGPATLRTSESEFRGHLVECFMLSFNTYHHFLAPEEAVLIASEESDGRGLDMQFRNKALFAVACRLSSRTQMVELGDGYATSADAIVLECIRHHPSDLVVQGLALLGWRDLMFGTQSMAYNWIAMATGQVLHLGLHVTALANKTVSPVMSSALYKRRVRSFWAYFSVDRLVTSSLGMNCTMHWQRVRPPPFLDTIDGDPDINEMAHDRFCQLWHLWDSCMDQVYAFGWADLNRSEKEALVVRSHEALVSFYQRNDERLQLRKDYMPETAVWLQLSYHTALILIHRPLLNEPSDSSAGKFALQSATTAAASIARIIRAYRKVGDLTHIAPQIIDYILTAAVIHLLNATSGRTALGRQSANSIRTCMDALSEMQVKWDRRAQHSIRRIQELAHRWEVVWALPIKFSQPLAPGELVSGDEQVNAADWDGGGLVGPSSAQGFGIFDDLTLGTTVEKFWESTSYQPSSGQSVCEPYTNSLIEGQGMPYLEWLLDDDDG